MTDLRLVGPALAAWAGAGAVLAVSDGLVPAWPLLALAVAVATVGITSRRTRIGAVLGVIAASAAALSALASVSSLEVEPVASAAVSHERATVVGRVRDEPSTVASRFGGDQRMTVVVTSAVDVADGGVVDVAVPVRIWLPADVDGVVPGAVLAARGRLDAPRPGSGLSAELRAGTVEVVSPPGVVDAVAHAMRVGLLAAVAPRPPDAGALVAGLAIGDDSLASAELVAAMRTSGLAHLVAVSGGNLAVVIAVLLALAGLVRLPRRAAMALVIAGMAGFVVLVGPQPSVLRAVAMATIVVLAAGARRSGVAVLSSAVLVLVLVAPQLARSWGFALSVAATAGLVLVAPVLLAWLRRRMPRMPVALAAALSMTMAAQVTTLPVLVAMGASVGLVSIPANLVAMPLAPSVTALGLLAAVVSPMAPSAAAAIAWVASVPAGWIADIAMVASRSPGAQVPLPSGLVGVAALLLGGAVVVGWLRDAAALPSRVRSAAVAGSAALALLWLVRPPSERSWPPVGWVAIACDVGQGDAVLLRAGERAAVVVDTGPEPARIDGCLASAGIDEVPAVVLTHFHADHIGGLAGVLRGRSVGVVLVTALREPEDGAALVDDVAGGGGVPVEAIAAGDVRTVGAVAWRVLWPSRVIREGSVPNNASLVLDAAVDGHHVLLTGDIEPPAQAAILPSLAGGGYEAAKVPHHGSAAQDPRFATTVDAPIAMVSVGADNDYGQPALTTLEAWTAAGSLIARTDESGDLALVPVDDGLGLVTRRG